jgi:hypothetical protein
VQLAGQHDREDGDAAERHRRGHRRVDDPAQRAVPHQAGQDAPRRRTPWSRAGRSRQGQQQRPAERGRRGQAEHRAQRRDQGGQPGHRGRAQAPGQAVADRVPALGAARVGAGRGDDPAEDAAQAAGEQRPAQPGRRDEPRDHDHGDLADQDRGRRQEPAVGRARDGQERPRVGRPVEAAGQQRAQQVRRGQRGGQQAPGQHRLLDAVGAVQAQQHEADGGGRVGPAGQRRRRHVAHQSRHHRSRHRSNR